MADPEKKGPEKVEVEGVSGQMYGNIRVADRNLGEVDHLVVLDDVDSLHKQGE